LLASEKCPSPGWRASLHLRFSKREDILERSRDAGVKGALETDLRRSFPWNMKTGTEAQQERETFEKTWTPSCERKRDLRTRFPKPVNFHGKIFNDR